MNNLKIQNIDTNKKNPKIKKELGWILKWLKIDKDWLVTSIKDWTYNCITDPKTLSAEDKIYIIYECEFDLYFKEWNFTLIDRQWACLWFIEDEKFKNLTEVIERIEGTYISDYFRWPFKDECSRKPEKYHFKIRSDEVNHIFNNWEKISKFKVWVSLKCKELEWDSEDEWGNMTSDKLVYNEYKLNDYTNSWTEVWYDWRTWEIRYINDKIIDVMFYDSNEIEEIDWVDLLMQNWIIDPSDSIIKNIVPNNLKTFELEFDTYSQLEEVDVYDILEILEFKNTN